MERALTAQSNLFDYFKERVDRAQAVVDVELSDDTGLYLASLLTERSRSEHRHTDQSTLAELHGVAQRAPAATQLRAYRELGDRALHLLGCFTESLEQTLVGPRYYAEMGAAAYHRVDRVLKDAFADPFGPVFRELSIWFDDCVTLLQEVRATHSEAGDPGELVRLYDRWITQRDPADARRLRMMGLDVSDGLTA